MKRSQRSGFLGYLLFAVAMAYPGLVAPDATAATLQFETPIAGDTLPVTLELVEAPAGDGVELHVSIPAGSGDLLGLFGNVVDEGLVPQLVLSDPAGLLTQWQFQADRVWKVGVATRWPPSRSGTGACASASRAGPAAPSRRRASRCWLQGSAWSSSPAP